MDAVIPTIFGGIIVITAVLFAAHYWALWIRNVIRIWRNEG